MTPQVQADGRVASGCWCIQLVLHLCLVDRLLAKRATLTTAGARPDGLWRIGRQHVLFDAIEGERLQFQLLLRECHRCPSIRKAVATAAPDAHNGMSVIVRTSW